jgi:phenylacetate-CoA ligase
VSNECLEEQNGAHVFEDHFLVEVIDPDSGESLPPGQTGELVFTTLTREALPVIRYRSGALASLNPAPCRCGRTFVRMSRVVGRTDDMLIIRGVNVFPSQVESALVGLRELSPHYQLLVTRDRTLDELEVKVESSEGFAKQLGGSFTGEESEVQELAMRCQRKLLGVLGINAKLTVVPPGAVPRSEGGKLRRVVDKRSVFA